MRSSQLAGTVLRIAALAGLMLARASQIPAPPRPPQDPAQTAAILAALPPDCSRPANANWVARVNRIRWVAYSSPNLDPDEGFHPPSAEAIYRDLLTLKKAKFTGLVTYGSAGIMGREFLDIAQAVGFNGVIMGIWNPRNRDELDNARAASELPIVLGYTIGNEGLYGSRAPYTLPELCTAIAGLRRDAGKPVTTSEEIDDYTDHPELLSVGDWIFPNAHPYWHSTKYARKAVQWEQAQYRAMLARTDLLVLFKEVGLPTSGAFGLSEANHDLYYRELAATDVRFVYFEAFDQPSKNNSSVEPNWGIFRAGRAPKLLGWNLMGSRRFTSAGAYDGWVRTCPGGSEVGCAFDSAAGILIVGSDSQRRQYRSILSFNTAGLPDQALLTSVKLKIRAAGIEGVNPFKQHAGLRVEVCRPRPGPALALQAGDYAEDLSCEAVAVLEAKAVNGWYSLDFPAGSMQAVDLSGVTQFRLSLAGEGEARGESYIKFYSGDADDPSRPVLLITYKIP